MQKGDSRAIPATPPPEYHRAGRRRRRGNPPPTRHPRPGPHDRPERQAPHSPRDRQARSAGPAAPAPHTMVYAVSTNRVRGPYTQGGGMGISAFGYTRVSSEGQATEGVSLDAQRARIAAWCAANDAELIDTFVDAGISGGRADNRPGLQRALDAVCRGKGHVLVVYSLSRMARSTKDTISISEHLHKSGANLVSLSEKIDTTSAAGKMVFRLLAVLAEFERDLASERTKLAAAYKRARGEA